MKSSTRFTFALLNSIIFFAIGSELDISPEDFSSYKIYIKILLSLAFGFSMMYFILRSPKHQAEK